MISHVAAAIDLVQLDATLRQQLITGNYIRPMSVTAQRNDRRMFKQQQRVSDQVLLPCRDDLLLDKETLQRIWVLRNHLTDMTPIEAMEFLKERITKTQSNEEFLISMND